MKPNDSYDVILVGGGPATRILNKYLHKLRPGIRTVMIRDEERIINHCGTPYIVEGEIPWDKGLIPDKMVTSFETEVMVDPLVGGDPANREIELQSGRRLRYETLVCATGTDQVVPPVPGADLAGVLKVRRTDDVQAAMNALGELEHAVVIGGGYIGLEFAVSLAHMGKTVTLIEMLPHVMGDRIDPQMATELEAHLRSLGIDIRLDAMVERIEGHDGRVTGVTLAGGEHLQAEAVLPAVGVRPLMGYAAALELETGSEGILVDDHFRTNQPDILALGDCTQTRCRITGRVVPGKLGSNAGQMARHLALNLLGFSNDPYPGVINAAITRLGGLAYGSAGLTEADAAAARIEVLVGRNGATDRYPNMPDPQPVEVKVLYRADDLRLIGGEIMGRFNPAGFIESLAQLIEREMTLTDVLTASYSSHPELTPKTNSPYWIWASEPLFFNLQANPVAIMGGSR